MGVIKNFNANTSLRTKFIIYFSLFALIPLAIMGVIVYNSAHRVNIEDSRSNLVMNASLIKEGYSNAMGTYSNMLEFLCDNDFFQQYLTGDTAVQTQALDRLKDAAKSLNSVSFLYVTDISGKVVLDSQDNTFHGNDYADREYLKRIKQTGQQTLSVARIDTFSGNPAVVYIDTIKAGNGSVVGYMGFVIDLKELSADILDKAKIMETGFVIAVETNTMNVIMTPETEKLFTDYVADVPGYKEALSDRSIEYFQYTINGQERMASFVPDEDLGWTYSAVVNLNEVTRVSSNVFMTVIILALVVLVAAPAMAIFISGSIIKPINRVSEAMGLVATGDLTIALNMQGKDNVMVMGQRLDSTIVALNESVTGVKEVASEVQGFSGNLALTMEQMSTATSEVTAAIQDVAKGATNQATDLTEIVNMLNVFAAEMDAIDSNVGQVRDSSQTAEGKAFEGKNQVSDLTSSIASIGSSFGTFMQTISELGVSVGKIGDITDAINSISDQTNLLALNAAIEAARAGEQGKGFAVVADEVRNLAAESKKSSEEIMELIRRVSQETQGVVKASEEVNGLLSNQKNVISKTVESFQMITDAIETIAPLVEHTKDSVNKATQAKDSVISRVEGVAAVSEEVSASAEEIAASSEELLSSIEDVSSVSGKMDHSVNNLIDRVKIYKTN